MTPTGELCLGRYHCLERLGSGPLGETYRARVYGIGGFEKEFSVQRLHEELGADATFLERLVRAASRAVELRGDRLVRLQEIDVDRGRYYLVADLVRGVELGLLVELLKAAGERLPFPCVLGIALDVAEGLLYAHGRIDLEPGGVLHLGLGPRTVVIDSEGEARLVDVGLYGALLQTGWDTARLPAEFLAPEVAGGGSFTTAADVYSFGALLQLLVGTRSEPAIAELVQRALEADPARRCPSMGELRETLLPLVDRAAARRLLGSFVARYLVPTSRASDPPPPSVVLPPVGDAPLDWESSEFDRLPTTLLDESAPDTRVEPAIASQEQPLQLRAPEPVPLPQPAPLPSPPTLPLAALRRPEVARLRLALALAAPVLVLGLGAAWWLQRPARGPMTTRAFWPGRARSLERRVQLADGQPFAVTTDPSGARVFVDGALRGQSPLEVSLPAGPHRVTVVAEGRQLVEQPFMLDAGGRNLEFPLVPATLPAGLKVHCETAGLRIYVDGLDTGRDCPNEERIDLQPGEHHLALHSPLTGETIAVHKVVHLQLKNRSTRIYLAY